MAQDSPTTEYLYDFLYVDYKKLQSYFPQLFDHGVLTHLKLSKQENDSSRQRLAAGVGVAKGHTEHSEGLNQALEKSFDATHTIPLTVIDKLDEEGFLSKDVHGASLGQLIMLEGQISVTETEIMAPLWEPMMKINKEDVIGGFNTTSPKKVAKNESEKALKNIIQLTQGLPHAVLFSLSTPHYQAWSTLERDALMVPPVDLMLKHGTKVPGMWHMLCIKDSEAAGSVSHAMSDYPSGDLTGATNLITDHLKENFGRPDGAFAVTPILIFRCLKPFS